MKKMNIADDFIHHNLTAMMIQETKLKGNNYTLYTQQQEKNYIYTTLDTTNRHAELE